MRIIDPQQTYHVHIVQRKRVFEPLWPAFRRRELLDLKPNAPAIREPIAAPMVAEQAKKGFIVVPAVHISPVDIYSS